MQTVAFAQSYDDDDDDDDDESTGTFIIKNNKILGRADCTTHTN
jgi:hypothetical protein